MITVHYLEHSRALRATWLLEELGEPYEVVRYKRDPQTMYADPALKKIHPLGKSPIVVDGDVTVAESGAMIEYLVDKYGKGRLRPDPASKEYVAYLEWLHYVEGSLTAPFMMNYLLAKLGEASAPLRPRIDSELALHLGYVADSLKNQDYLVGDSFSGADVQLGTSFVLAPNLLGPYPALERYAKRLKARPAFQRAFEKSGP